MDEQPDQPEKEAIEAALHEKEQQELYERGMERLKSFREELIMLFHKSQDTFETQLSFIAGGSLSLSVGFIKDIVQPFKTSSYKGLLGWGWGLLVLTLLLNCISHLIAARYANKGIKEINEDVYDPVKVNVRNKRIGLINIFTVITMIIGIGLIVAFITYNTLT